jgi:RNA polymerase sigma factor (sigma-70 family)
VNEVHDVVDAVWKAESARVIAVLTRIVRDVGAAEECAQDALVAALRQWPREGVPDNPAAWITTAAKRRALDRIRRDQRLEREHERIARDLERAPKHSEPSGRPGDPDTDPGDVLRLLLLTCHPSLSVGERVALTLRLVTGLTDNEIGRALLTPEHEITRRVAAAKRTLAEHGAALEPPGPREAAERLPAVLAVVWRVFNEGYTATAGPGLMRPRLCEEALRTGRITGRASIRAISSS